MHNRSSVHRRTLRPTAALSLIEGAVIHADGDRYVTVEVAGGPPGATATVSIGGAVCDHFRLDWCGTGTARVPTARRREPVEIAVLDEVLLTGTLPCASPVRRPA